MGTELSTTPLLSLFNKGLHMYQIRGEGNYKVCWAEQCLSAEKTKTVIKYKDASVLQSVTGLVSQCPVWRYQSLHMQLTAA